MLPRSRNILITILVLIVAACAGPNRLTKKAAKLENANAYAQAAGLYARAVKKKPSYIQAKNGLNRTSLKVLNDKVDLFSKKLAFNNKEEAVEHYLDAEKYQQYISSLGVKHSIPSHITEKYIDIKNEVIEQWYAEGTKFFEAKNYQAAENLFSKILRLVPNYKNAHNLLNAAQLEPLYINGTLAFNGKRFREAYYYFIDIVNQDAQYKNSQFLLDESLKLGKVTVALLPFYNTTRSRNVSQKFSAYLLTSLTNSPDPFIQVVDRENIDLILQEQEFGLSGIIDEASAVKMGKLLGAKVAVTGKILEYRPQRGALGKTKIDAFEKYTATKTDPESGLTTKVTDYRPTSYIAYTQENKVFMSVQYQLISLETGIVLGSEIINQTVSDYIDYIDYRGKVTNLHPRSNNKPDKDSATCQALRARAKGKRNIVPITELNTELQRIVGEHMAQLIEIKLSTL